MPTNRKRRTRNIFQELSGEQIDHLISGYSLDDIHHPFFALHADPGFPFKDDLHRKELYFRHKEFLTGLVKKKPLEWGGFFGAPEGKKPQAFYDYEAK